eukprot:5017055-Amphidinium_carterae.1
MASGRKITWQPSRYHDSITARERGHRACPPGGALGSDVLSMKLSAPWLTKAKQGLFSHYYNYCHTMEATCVPMSEAPLLLRCIRISIDVV